nr:unnamed protein product [Callosobruchus chinensis]CAH7768128.1 unnamed protein product [Callosobruchus chinensis]
MLHLTL